MKDNALRGKIIEKYHTVKNFANALKWSKRKTYDIVNGKQEPTGKDIDAMCTALDVVVPSEMKRMFF